MSQSYLLHQLKMKLSESMSWRKAAGVRGGRLIPHDTLTTIFLVSSEVLTLQSQLQGLRWKKKEE